jgi:hypothetical protein
MSDAWYAVWTRSRPEQIVREQPAQKGYEAFLPTVARWSRWKDRKKKIDWPLFPGYSGEWILRSPIPPGMSDTLGRTLPARTPPSRASQ